MSRHWTCVVSLVSLFAAAGEPFSFDEPAAIELASTYLRGHPDPEREHGHQLNFHAPHVFAVIGQLDRHFVAVGFGWTGNIGGSFAVLEKCTNGLLVVALTGNAVDFANYHFYVSSAVNVDVAPIPDKCQGHDA